MDWVFIVSFAIILAAFTGIRAFLPITITAIFAKFNLISIKAFYNIPFIDFITDDRVLAFLVIATIIEILFDKIPAVDNFLDGVYTFLKPLISFVAVYGIFYNLEPWQASIVAITFSLISNSTMMGTKNIVRLTSTATTAGTANPFISLLEDILVSIKTSLSLIVSWLLPIIAVLSLIITVGLIIIFFKVSGKVLEKNFRKD